VAAAIGLATAVRGRRTVVCEVGSEERLARTFGVAPAGPGEEVALRPGLAATSIDPNAVLRHWLEVQLHSRTLVAFLSRAPIFQYFVAAAPGAREVITLAQAWNLTQPQRWGTTTAGYDTVVVDAPSSGHALGMLRTPRTFADIARVGTVRRQADRVRALITDPRRTGYLVVATPEEMPVAEALEFERRLEEEVGVPPSALVANAVSPHRFSAGELESLAAAETKLEPGPRERQRSSAVRDPVATQAADARATGARAERVRAALTVAHAEGRRSLLERAQLARLRRGSAAPVVTLPRLIDGELGPEGVARLATELERKLAAASARERRVGVAAARRRDLD
jgi:anion-transporting  ArsA/GET3 family ATPase